MTHSLALLLQACIDRDCCASKIRVPLSKGRQGPGELYFYAFWGHFGGFWRIVNAFGVGCRRGWLGFYVDLAHLGLILADFEGDFYGMKRARVGAFTDFGTFWYRNPVQILAHFTILPTFPDFRGWCSIVAVGFGDKLTRVGRPIFWLWKLVGV